MYADVPGIQVCVHNIFGLKGWYLNCPELGIRDVNLQTDDFREAAERANMVVRKEFEKLETAVNKFLEN